jgi:hypothetical protein
MKRGLAALAALWIPSVALATTAPDLSGRIVIDGSIGEYAADEWVLDDTSPRPERPDDSTWGSDNDVRRVAVTWDSTFLYIAVDCATFQSGVMLWIEHEAGGLTRLDGLGDLRRQVSFSDFAPNYVVSADRGGVTVARVSAIRAMTLRPDDEVPRAFTTPSGPGGALEVAIPWSEVAPPGGAIRLVAAITGGTDTGSGDAAPDPSAQLPGRRTASVLLDQVLSVTVDAGGDGRPDEGVSPRAAASVTPGGAVAARSTADIEVRPVVRTFAPDRGELVEFGLASGAGAPLRVFVSARVYTMDGRLVRVLYEDDERVVDPGANAPAVADRWDGTDAAGKAVAGGMYAINVVWGQARGAKEGASNAAVAVVR